jgi:hypothetical protein
VLVQDAGGKKHAAAPQQDLHTPRGDEKEQQNLRKDCIHCWLDCAVVLIIMTILQPVHQWFPSHISGCASCGQTPAKNTSCDTACNMTLPGVDTTTPSWCCMPSVQTEALHACWYCM